MKKSNKGLIIASIVCFIILLCAGGAFAYIYVATDLLKSNQELFFEYLSQVVDEENSFFDKNIDTYFAKKEQTPYENTGNIRVNFQAPDESLSDNLVESINNFNIRFSGKTNNTKKNTEQNIELDFGQDMIIPINYRRNSQLYGLQSKYIGSKYIALENSNLKELVEKLGMDSSEIPDKIELEQSATTLEFTQEEKAKAQADSNYQERSPLRIVINVTAEQFVESEDAVDINYNLGDVVLYDVINDQPCSQLSDSCIKTYVIDTDNKLGDDNVNLLPDLYDSYAEGTFDQYSSNLTAISNNWNVTTRSLKVQDLLKIISLDVVNSIRGNDVFSDMIIGNMSYGTRIDSEITRMSAVNSYYKYLNERFPFLSTSKCYWLDNEYNSTKSFAFSKLDDTYSIVEGKDKSTTCSVVPVIIASKSSFN